MVEKEAKKLGDIKRLVYMGMLIGISYIGSLIRIYDSIALDSMAGYFAALFLDPFSGAMVSIIGHLLTALNSGFPRTLPLHIVISLGMGISTFIFGKLARKKKLISATILGVGISSFGMLAIAAPLAKFLKLPLNGMAMVTILALPLTTASLVNILLAYGVYKILKDRI